MYAKQYEIALPADYDMGIIRQRVADKGHALDDRAGLLLKAYLIRERGVDGSPVNQYAPFYLWHDSAAMAHFLFGGGGFQNIVRDFGRPPVRHWTGVATVDGPATHATTATRTLTTLPPDIDPATALTTELAGLRTDAEHPDVHTAALAVDPYAWQLMRFTLWRDHPADDVGERYQVLHLSTPRLPD
jgi:hypothetical protein